MVDYFTLAMLLFENVLHYYYYYYYYINYCVEINADYSAQVYYIVCIYLDYYKSDQGLGS